MAIAIGKAVADCSSAATPAPTTRGARGARGGDRRRYRGHSRRQQPQPGGQLHDVPGGTAHWVFSGGTNYTDQSGDVAITIGQAASTTTVTCPPSVIFTGFAQTPCSASVTGVGGLNNGLTVGYTNNTNAGTATASASYPGDLNHAGGSASKTFSILFVWTGFLQPINDTAHQIGTGGEQVQARSDHPCQVRAQGRIWERRPASGVSVHAVRKSGSVRREHRISRVTG